MDKNPSIDEKIAEFMAKESNNAMKLSISPYGLLNLSAQTNSAPVSYGFNAGISPALSYKIIPNISYTNGDTRLKAEYDLNRHLLGLNLRGRFEGF